MDCPKCQSKNNVKNGIVGNRQRIEARIVFIITLFHKEENLKK